MPIGLIVGSGLPTHNSAVQPALPPDAVPLHCAAQVKHKLLSVGGQDERPLNVEHHKQVRHAVNKRGQRSKRRVRWSAGCDE